MYNQEPLFLRPYFQLFQHFLNKFMLTGRDENRALLVLKKKRTYVFRFFLDFRREFAVFHKWEPLARIMLRLLRTQFVFSYRNQQRKKTTSNGLISLVLPTRIELITNP